MPNKTILSIIALEVVNEYYDILGKRIQEQNNHYPRKVYIYDCLGYTISRFTERGIQATTEIFADVVDIVCGVICIYCIQANITGRRTLSDDFHYLLIS